MLKKFIISSALISTLAFSFAASATIQIMTTRVAFNAGEKEQTIRINNISKTPELVQVWLSSSDKADGIAKEDLPFFITLRRPELTAKKGKFSAYSRRKAQPRNILKIVKRYCGSMSWIFRLKWLKTQIKTS